MKKYLPILIILCFVVSDNLFAQVTFGTGKINVRVDAYGAVRIFTTEGTDTVEQIERSSVLVAGNPFEVLDYWNDVDIEVETTLEPNPQLSDFEISGTYNNSYSGLPPNVLVEQHVYGWSNQSFCLIKMIVTNMESSAIPSIVGMDIIQYIDETYENDHIFYDMTNDMMTQYDAHYIGIKILSEPTTSGQILDWYDGYEVDSSYYNWMIAATFDTDTLITGADGGLGIMAGEEQNLNSGESRTFYYAIAAGTSSSDMMTNMDAAIQAYNTITSVEADHNNIPDGFVLEQNYPNPFNPSTTIKFGIPEGSQVVLKVFNSIGEEVGDLINQYLSAGTYNYHFDASKLTSGVYYYTLQADRQIVTKKMTLIK